MRFVGKALGVAALATLAGFALAQMPGWGGMGPGYGPGPMMPYGGGPGMMHGFGPGSYGGPGMMGWGGGGMGWGGGPGMMHYGYELQGALGLSDDQRKKLDAIHDDMQAKNWDIMGKMSQRKKLDAIHDDMQAKNWDIMGKMRAEMVKMRELMATDPLDKAALDAAYKRMSDLRQQRFDARLAAHEQMLALLTKEQREQLKRFGPWWPGYDG